MIGRSGEAETSTHTRSEVTLTPEWDPVLGAWFHKHISLGK